MIYEAYYRLVRFVQKVLLVAAGVIALALAVALIPVFAGEPQRGAEPVAAKEPVVPEEVVPSAPPEGGGEGALPSSRAAQEDDEAPHGGTRGEDGRGGGVALGPDPQQLLCSPGDELLYAGGDGVAFAADPNGHFAFYGIPDPETGRPTRDSYDLLRGCSAGLSFANLTQVEVQGPLATDRDMLGNGRVARPTRRLADGSLVTVHEPSQGLRVTQKLSLVGRQSGGARDTLRISYRLRNFSDEPTELVRGMRNEPITVSLASLIAPPLAVVGRDDSGLPTEDVFALPGEEAGVRNERAYGAGEIPEKLRAPRPGAASDASGTWAPGAEGPAPDRLVLGGWLKLSADPLAYDVPDPAAPLAENAAISARWSGIELAPGEELTVSHTYSPSAPSTPNPG